MKRTLLSIARYFITKVRQRKENLTISLFKLFVRELPNKFNALLSKDTVEKPSNFWLLISSKTKITE